MTELDEYIEAEFCKNFPFWICHVNGELILSSLN